LNPTWFLEAQVANHIDKFNETGYANLDSIQDQRTNNFLNYGGLGYVGQSSSENIQISAKLTNVIKNHEVKYGFSLEDIAFDNTTNYTGEPRCFNYFDPETGELKEGCTVTGNIVKVVTRPYGNRYNLVRNRVGQNTVATHTRYWNWFAQDSWSINPFVTVKAGIRWERQFLEGGGPGHGNVTLTNNWAPRVGASWDFMHDGKSKAYGFWGRYFEKIPNDAAVRSLSVEKMLNIYYVDPTFSVNPLDWYSVFQDINNFYAASEYGFEPTQWETGAKSMYQDEFVAGVEREIKQGFNVSGRFIYRTLGRVIEDFQLSRLSDIYCGFEGTDPNCVPADYGSFMVGNVSSQFPGMPDPQRIYKAFELVANKRLRNNWQMMASWRISRLTGNYEGLFNNDNGQSDPNITSKFDFPYVNDRIFWGPTGDQGVLPIDQTHIIRLFGSYALKYGMNIGLGLNAQSGIPISMLGYVYDYGANERLLEPRGSQGRTKWVVTVDAHADYTFKITEGQQITAIFDIFNIPNLQTATNLDMAYESADVGIPNPAFKSPTAFQAPRQVRFGLRYTF
jgi:hypothetical protein